MTSKKKDSFTIAGTDSMPREILTISAEQGKVLFSINHEGVITWTKKGKRREITTLKDLAKSFAESIVMIVKLSESNK